MHEKTATASYAASAVVMSASALDWNTICMVGGLVLGILTFGVNWYFKFQNSKAYRSALSKGVKLNGPSE